MAPSPRLVGRKRGFVAIILSLVNIFCVTFLSPARPRDDLVPLALYVEGVGVAE